MNRYCALKQPGPPWPRCPLPERTTQAPPGKKTLVFASLHWWVCISYRQRDKAGLTFNLGVGTLFSTANVNEIKRRHSLREARSELPDGGLAIHSTARLCDISQARKIGYESGSNLNATGTILAKTIPENSMSQGIGGLFPAVDALLNKSLLELDRWSRASVWVGAIAGESKVGWSQTKEIWLENLHDSRHHRSG